MTARGLLAALLATILSIGQLRAGAAKPTTPATPKPPAARKAESPQQRSARLGDLYERAEALYRQRQYRDAQKLYAQIALEQPGYRRVAARIRSIRDRLHDGERRQREARIATLLDDADKHFAAGNYEPAAKAAEQVLAIDPKSPRARRRLAECAGELELHRRMFSIFEVAEPAQGERRVVAQAPSALTRKPTAPPPAPAAGGAPVVRAATHDAKAPPANTTRIVRPGENVETTRPPARPGPTPQPPAAPDPAGARLLSQAWDLYQSAKLADDPRPVLRKAMDTLAPITPISGHSQHTKDTAAMLRNSIARRLAQGGRALTAEEAQQARLYGRYLDAEQHYRKKRYGECAAVCREILEQDRSFVMARRLHTQARMKQQQHEFEEKNLEQTLMMERRFADIEDASVPPDDLPPVGRPPIDLERPRYEVASPELEEKLNQRVSVNLIQADLDYFLDLLFRSTGVNIIYNPEVVEGKTITVHVANYPLRQLLDYIARNHGLMFATTRDGVLITTPEEPRLETFVIPLHYGLVDVTVAPESAAVAGQGSASPPIDPPDSSNVEQLVEQFPQLIDWPDGSFTYLDRKMNLLYVRTTREVYQQVLDMLEPIDQIPHQVLIKTLFVEIDLEEFESFGISTTLSDVLKLGKLGRTKLQINQGEVFKFPTEQLPGLTTPDSGMTLGLTGVLDEPQFEIVLDALQRTGKARTLAAPNVICINNCTARISVTKDLIYVEDYEVDRSDISGTTYGNPWNYNQQQQQTGGNYPLSSEPIIIPVFAEGEDTGFTLDVAPSIGKDSRYIAMMLNPRIREEIPPRLSFELVFPVTSIQSADDAEDMQPQTATVERPIIGERSVSTKLTVADGAIVVLGGLIQQKKIQVRSKVPILSDIPIIGQFIGRDTYRDKKTNLLIFVEAELITPTGARYTDSGRIDAVRAAEEAARIELEDSAAPPVVRPGP